MSADQALHIMTQMLVAAVFLAGPILIVTLVIGILISVIQVATQLQEMSLSYVPKLIGAVAVLVALGPWMLNRLTAFAIGLISSIPNLA